MPRSSKLRFVSIFSGCGGFDIGFEQAGFQCTTAFDSDPIVLENHRRYVGAPVRKLDLASGSLLESGLDGIDVLLAGPPCQGFSVAGKRDIEDSRNHLLLSAGKIAVQLQPKVCIIENVPGVAFGGHRVFWEALEAMLKASGYRTSILKCSIEKLGLAQIRTRLVMIAWRTKRDHPTLQLPEAVTQTLRSALANIGNTKNHVPRFLPEESRLAAIASGIGPGQKLCNVRGGPRSIHTWDLPKVFGQVSTRERDILEAILRLRRRDRRRDAGDADPVSRRSLQSHLGRETKDDLRSLMNKQYVRRVGTNFDLTNTFNGKFRRLSWEKPSLAVDTRFGQPRYFLHPDQNRGFTVREAARIQGFPDSFVFSGPSESQYKMVGNAVPPPMGAALGKVVRAAFFG